jgi:hypothetical protein
MQHQGTPSNANNRVTREARALVTDPLAGYMTRELRLAAWAILKAGRGQAVCQSRLNAMPFEGFRP